MIAGDSKDPVGAAHRRVHRAVTAGLLVKLALCEVCGIDNGKALHAHHHKGYQYAQALDVWWVCTQCNALLWGKHDGTLALEEARQMAERARGAGVVILAGGRVWQRLGEGVGKAA